MFTARLLVQDYANKIAVEAYAHNYAIYLWWPLGMARHTLPPAPLSWAAPGLFELETRDITTCLEPLIPCCTVGEDHSRISAHWIVLTACGTHVSLSEASRMSYKHTHAARHCVFLYPATCLIQLCCLTCACTAYFYVNSCKQCATEPSAAYCIGKSHHEPVTMVNMIIEKNPAPAVPPASRQSCAVLTNAPKACTSKPATSEGQMQQDMLDIEPAYLPQQGLWLDAESLLKVMPATQTTYAPISHVEASQEMYSQIAQPNGAMAMSLCASGVFYIRSCPGAPQVHTASRSVSSSF